jgi:hypothetical protein
MLGFKRFDTAAVTIRGIELAEKIKKGQFNLEKLAGKPVTIPAIWTAVLAASSLENHLRRQIIHLTVIYTRVVIFSEKAGDKGPHATSIRAAGKHQPIAAPEE